MFGLAIRKRIDEDKLSNIFVNSIIEVVENGFEDLTEMIQDDPAFLTTPTIPNKAYQQFLLIIVTGNLNFLKNDTQIENIDELESLIQSKFANIFEIPASEFKSLIDQTQSFIGQVNYPSRNYLYGLSKAVFFKYDLNQFQESYFKSMNTPNPLFLKRLDEFISNFLWDWDSFFKKHKIQ